MFAAIHEVSQLLPTRTQLIGHALPGFPSMFTVGLLERLPDRGGDDCVRAARGMRIQ